MKVKIFKELKKVDSDDTIDLYEKVQELALEHEDELKAPLTEKQAEFLEEKYGDVTYRHGKKIKLSPYHEYSPSDCGSCYGTGLEPDGGQCEDCLGTGKAPDNE